MYCMQALDEDQPGSKIMYKKLFEEDREYNQGATCDHHLDMQEDQHAPLYQSNCVQTAKMAHDPCV